MIKDEQQFTPERAVVEGSLFDHLNGPISREFAKTYGVGQMLRTGLPSSTDIGQGV